MTRDTLPGTLPDGHSVQRITLDNGTLRVAVLDFGAALYDVRHASHPDLPLVLSPSRADAYDGPFLNFGTIMGPVANRIRGAEAEIDGQTYGFDANQAGRHSLHSGAAGVNRKIWTIDNTTPDSVTLSIDLPDGEGGYPGNRRITSTYRLDGDTLVHDQTAATDHTTLMNLAHHGYWTMQPPTGWGGQELTIGADHYTPTDADVIPTGEIASVENTPFDFRQPVTLQPAKLPNIDHNFCLNGDGPALRLSSPATGLALEITTDAPGLQIFGFHAFETDPSIETLHGHPYARHAALAIEPQRWPDAPGRPDWPDITLRPGETFSQTARYQITTDG
ncbi:aldose epimerase family protein [Palleronia caenipelagi]|uniref:Galactose mutarotase n=1 Tax=Palleronia caenipelagi TaxID=2489174 RepID=A0A547Q8T7_9RHOB|nr:aldose epimerase family protein [Palleronia caenipelagi]TRD22805.1 galactose mutarotase [Palleronia caenipelagi]